MFGAGSAAGPAGDGATDARDGTLVRRKGQEVLRYTDSDAKPSAIETQEKQPDAIAQPQCLAESEKRA
jgi:hypothetical protein